MEGTGNPFHLALEGDGFFVIQTARGERYTRNGGFTLKSDGTLMTPQGEPVLGDSGPLLISGNKIEVASDGTVRSDQGEIGRLKLVRFTDSTKVFKEGSNLFITDPGNIRTASDQATGNVRVVQGSLEQSNVSPVDGMISLISIHRQFDSYERIMRLMDSITQKMIAAAGQ